MEKEFVRVEEGGKAIYKTHDGEVISTYSEDLSWIALYELEPLRDFINLMHGDDDRDPEGLMGIADKLLSTAEARIQGAATYIKENYGIVEIERAQHHQAIEPETKLGIIFKPAKNGAGRA